MKTLKLFCILTLTFIATGCIFRPYQAPVQQGNLITQNMLKQLKPGMSRQQVQYILGSPNIVSPYHPDTWYYVYTLEKDYQPRAERKLVIHFKDNKLDSFSGNYQMPFAQKDNQAKSAS